MNIPMPGTAPDFPPPLPESLCHLNGEYLRLCDAKVSVLDRGFIFGDGVYEVLPAYGGRIFRFEQHMARLDRSLGALRIQNPHTHAEWLAIARRLIDALVAPTAGPAWPTDPVLGDHFTGAGYGVAAVAGTPSVTVPSGEVDGLPIGLVFMGRPYSEPELLAMGFAFEQATKARKAPRFLPTLAP